MSSSIDTGTAEATTQAASITCDVSSKQQIHWIPLDLPEAVRAHQRLRALCVLDFEAQCDNTKRLHPQEIIEFPTVLIDIVNNRCAEFHTYVKPDVYPILTPFCKELTHIRQDQVDTGVSLKEALELNQEFLAQAGLVQDDGSFAFVTCGDWDLKRCLASQAKYLKLNLPPCYQQWINIKRSFKEVYGVNPRGMVGMLDHLGMRLEGQHHSGIDDSRNIAKVAKRMLVDGWVARINGSVN
jgi:inhibitor of KinA sporulation pathway (predicted exonuclease)